MALQITPICPRLLPPFLLLHFFIAAGGLQVIDTNIVKCPDYDCGNGVKITYPFWISIDSTSFCGYPDFTVTCNGTTPIFRTYADYYIAKKIGLTDRTISLVDTDAGGLTCPRPSRNVTLSSTPLLSFAPSTGHLVFFLNCESYDGSPIPESNHATCLNGSSGKSYVFDGMNNINFTGLLDACNESIISPVMKTQLYDGSLGTTFGKAINGGFDLTWRYPDMKQCTACEQSDGRCGYINEPRSGLVFQCYCGDGVHPLTDCNGGTFTGSSSTEAMKIGIGVGAAILAIAFILVALGFVRFRHKRKSHLSSFAKQVEEFLASHEPLAVKRYGYSQVKAMTRSFSSMLGKGGYGTVYKGYLHDGVAVAVKLLGKMKGSGEEFINEVASIGQTNHVNVVRLLGFCSEGSTRALIYEFMPNGSLDKHLSLGGFAISNDSSIGLEQLHNIAVGIARGLEYLHKWCNTHIVHFDIKPHNILLDEDLCPKISDFGLAKLYKPKEAVLSMVRARGTIGYIAPELFLRNYGKASSKSDVYSYGVMVLEMVGGRSVGDEVKSSNETYYPNWIYEQLDRKSRSQNFEDLIRSELAWKMTLVGLWCIQSNPSSRPSISRVVEMLEGRVGDLHIPPKPYLYSPPLSRHDSRIDSSSLVCSSS